MSLNFKSILAWITGASIKIKQALGFGHDVANWLKVLADTGALDAIAKATPWKWDDALLPGFKSWLAELVYDLEITSKVSTDVAIMEASQKINNMSSDARAILLNGISAAAATWHAEQVGKTSLPISQSLAAAQPVYEKVEVLRG